MMMVKVLNSLGNALIYLCFDHLERKVDLKSHDL